MAQALRAGLRNGGLRRGGFRPGLGNGSLFAIAPLDMFFARTRTLDSRVTFTRASSGTYVGSDGLLKTATTNQPRFDHNPTTGESLGLMVEEQRTNLVFPSSDLTNINYVKARSSLSAATVAPDGTSTAFGIIEDTSTNSHEIRSPGFAITLGQAVSYSFYVKPSGRNQIFFSVGAGSGGPNDIVITNLNSSSYSTSVGGGWYRISGTFVPTATTTVFAYFGPASGGSKSYTGDGVTIGSYFWGFQIEAGAFPTSYIPTTAATATRSTDVASITGTNFSSWYRQDEGTIAALNWRPSSVAAAMAAVGFGANPLNNTDWVALIRSTESGGRVRLDAKLNNIRFADNIGRNTAATPISVAAGLSSAPLSLLAGGLAGSGTVSASALPSASQLRIGQSSESGTATMCGTIARITYWPQRLAEFTLQQITQ